VINLRYHIVSLTAVFLALGIGLTLGSTFLDRVTVDTLKNQLDTVQARVDETEAENSSLRDRLTALEEREAGLMDGLAERLVAGHLDEVPVLVVAAAGTPEPLIDRTLAALTGAGAQPVGTWELTDRWDLDDEEEIRDLSDVLDVRTDDADRLRRNGAIRLADAIVEAIEPDPEATEEPETGADAAGASSGDAAATAGEGVAAAQDDDTDPLGPPPPEGEEAEEPPAPPPTEPEAAAALEAAGFLAYDHVPDGEDRVLLPTEGLRVVVVASTPSSGPVDMALALLDEVTAEGPVPVVAAQGAVEVTDEDGDLQPEADRRTGFVGPLRSGELTRDRLSTIDSLDTAAGLAALVLAVEDAGELRLGHYGVAPGASHLLPGAEPPS